MFRKRETKEGYIMANKRPSQANRLLDYLKKSGSITTWEAFKELGITRLSARIFEIKERGYLIKTESITGKNKLREPIHYNKYSLIEENK